MSNTKLYFDLDDNNLYINKFAHVEENPGFLPTNIYQQDKLGAKILIDNRERNFQNIQELLKLKFQ